MRNILLPSAGALSLFGCLTASDAGGQLPQPSDLAFRDGGLPSPSGRYAVGNTSAVWTDSTRSEVASLIVLGSAGEKPSAQDASGSRQIEAHLWYPAESPRGKVVETASYNPDLESFVGLLDDPELISAQRALRTVAIAGAPVASRAGRLPVLLFSPGGGMFASDYTTLAQDLASHGYLVLVVAHPGVTLMRRGAGAVSAEWDGWNPPPDLKMDLDLESLRASSAFFARRDSLLAGDLSFALDELAKADTDVESFLRGRIDLERVAVAGHSTGGAAAAMAAELDNRIDGLIVFDVLLPRTMFGTDIRTPFLLMRTDGVGYPPGWNDAISAPFSALRDVGYDVVVNGARHQSFSDKPFQRPEQFGGTTSAKRIAAIISLYVRTFLDHHLRGSSLGPAVGADAPERVVATVHRGGSPPPGQR